MKKTWIVLFILCSIISSSSLWAQEVIRVALLPFTVHAQEDLTHLQKGIWDIVSSRLMAEGKIQVISRSALQRFLSELKGVEITEKEARWLGYRVGADYVVMGSITKVGDYISLDAKVINITGDRPILSVFAQHRGLEEVMVKIDAFANDIRDRILKKEVIYFRSATGQLRSQLLYQAIGYTKLRRFPKIALKGVDVGDVDGDGKNEITLISKNHLWVYRDTGDKLEMVAELKGATSENFLTVDVLDLDGDGKAEIAVTDVIEDTLNSFILRYAEGGVRYMAKGLNWYLRARSLPEKGPVLLAQRMGNNTDYEGPIRVVQWKGKFHVGPALKGLPKEVEDLFSFNYGYLTESGNLEVLYLTPGGELKLLSVEGELLWKSKTGYGLSDNYFDRPEVLADRKGMPTPFPRRVYLPTRIIVKDLDGDGFDEVTLIVNRFKTGEHVEKVRAYDRGYIEGLVWDGMALAEAWRTQDIPGYVADIAIKDSDNDGRDELVAVSVYGHFLKREARSNLLVFELYE